MSQYLGIEIGGTKLQIGVGSNDGTLTNHWRETVDVESGGEGIRQRLLEVVPTMLTEDVRAIGIGFGGPVDDETGLAIISHQVDGWDRFPLKQWSESNFQLPTFIGNDSDVSGLGEAIHGAGQGISPLFYMNIGSGIGGALILDGNIYRGVGRGAAEIGHLRMNTGNEWMILEHLSSGWAIGRRASERMGKSIRADEVAHAANNGNVDAQQILQESIEWLAEGLCHVITLLCPRRIVIGGGVSLIGEQLLFEPLRREVEKRVFRPFLGEYDIVPAALSESIVLHGAIALAHESSRGTP